jgi:hypothetical protein
MAVGMAQPKAMTASDGVPSGMRNRGELGETVAYSWNAPAFGSAASAGQPKFSHDEGSPTTVQA